MSNIIYTFKKNNTIVHFAIDDPIKTLGTFIVSVKLYEGVVAKLKISVIGM